MPATTGPTEAVRQATTPTRPSGGGRSVSAASANRQRTKDGYGADHDIDDGEEGDYEGDDGEDDEDEMQASGEGYGGQNMLNETTIKSGYLWKRGEKRKNWKKRWFALRSSKLCYYKNEKEYQLLRFIDMADVHTVAAIALKKNENSFGIVTSKRQYYVRASNAKDMQSWIDALKEVQQQAKQSSTMTQDMAAMEVATSSGGENAQPSAARPKQAPASPNLVPLERQQSVKVNVNANAAPINIVIPGKGLYTSPAQPRQNSTGTSILSPLTVTSESDAGTATGAEQFGLSYASSQGHSMASSPTRQALFHHHPDHSSGGRASPQSHSGGDDLSDNAKRSKAAQRGSAPVTNEASTIHSGGEGSSSIRTGWTASKVQGASTQAQTHQQGQGGPVLSSSDEDGEGDDWDEDEVADQAMPLPGSSAVTSTVAAHSAQQGASVALPTGNGAKEKVESQFLKDPNKVILQGYLMKQSSRRKQWRKRYFTLTSSSLSYSRSHMNGKAHRQIPLSSILDAIEYTSKKAQNSVQSPPPSSPAMPNMQSPSTNAAAGSAHGGATTHDNAAGGSGAQKEAAVVKGGETGAEHAPPLDRKNSLLAAATPNAPRKKKENCFKIITPKRTYVVGAPTEEEELRWLCALQALLARWRDVNEAENADQGANRPAAATSSNSQAANAASNATTPIRLNRRGSTADDLSAQE